MFIEINRSVIGLNQANYHIKSGGFTGSVRAQQTYDLSLLYIDRYLAYNGSALVAFDQVFGIYGNTQMAKFRQNTINVPDK